MIFDLPARDDPVDQGDIIDGCPVLRISQLPSWPVFLNDSTASVEDACPAFPVLFRGDEVF